jgi:hypothetical protein
MLDNQLEPVLWRVPGRDHGHPLWAFTGTGLTARKIRPLRGRGHGLLPGDEGLTRQIREPTAPDTTGRALTLDPGARPLRTQPQVSAAATLWRETNSAIGSATAAGSVATEK